MNPPRLLRPLRPFLQGQLPRATVRSQAAVSRASTQLRRNGNIASDPPAAGAPKPAAASTPETPKAAPVAAEPNAAAAPTEPVAPAVPAVPKAEPVETPRAAPTQPTETVAASEAPKQAAPEAPKSVAPEAPKAAAPVAPQPAKTPPAKPEAVAPEVPKQASPKPAPEAPKAPAAPEAPKAAPKAPKPAPAPLTPEEIAFREEQRKKSKAGMEKLRELREQPQGSVDLSRMPRALEALYLQPLRRKAEYGIPSCDLQLRSYSLPNMEFFCDFALRAAYYLGLPAFGPVPLPKKIERWTVPKGHFVHKKSQENFERITLRRLIQIKDGHPETVQVWLAFLQKYAYYGIGMKANMWEFSKLDVAKEMEESLPETEKLLESKWQHIGVARKSPVLENLEEFMAEERRRISGGR